MGGCVVGCNANADETEPLTAKSYGSTEDDVALTKDHNNHGEEEEEEAKVTTLELFSDLAIVVAIHIVAEPLEEPVIDGGLSWFCIRVFMLWVLWQFDMIFMNAGVVFRRADCPVHFTVVFIWMGLILQMTQAFARNDDRTAIILFLVTHAIEIISYSVQVSEKPPEFISTDRIKNMQSMVPFMLNMFIFFEVIPFMIALYFGNEQEIYRPPIYFFVFGFIGYNYYAAHISDLRTDGKIMENTFATDHLHERYELVTLIFIGEICFAAGKNAGHEEKTRILVTCSALVEAFGAYLIMFTTRPAGQPTSFWSRSAKHMMTGIFLFALLFSAIPGLGAGFVRILEPEEKEGEELDSFDRDSCNKDTADMLCHSTAAFLFVSALINSLEWSPSTTENNRIGILGRVFIRSFFSLIAIILPYTPSGLDCIGGLPIATFVCPAACMLSAMLEVYAVNSLKMAQMSVPDFTYLFI